jgi:WD40 repeat protein
VGDTVADLAWSPVDGRLGVGCSAGEVVVFDASGHTVERHLRHPAGTLCITWFEGEIASGGADGWVDIAGQRHHVGGWVAALDSGEAGLGVAHGRRVSILGKGTSDPLPASVTQVRWLMDGHHRADRLIACGHGFVSEFDGCLTTRTDANLLWGGSIEHVDWSPDGRWAAAGTRGTTNYLWRRPTEKDAIGSFVDRGEHVHVLACPSGIGRLTRFDPTGRLLTIACSDSLAVFDLDDIHPVAGPPSRLLPLFCRVSTFAWWPDAPVAILGVDTADGGGGLLLVRCDEYATPVGVVDLNAPVTGISWSPRRDFLAIAGRNGVVTVMERIEDWDWDAPDELGDRVDPR